MLSSWQLPVTSLSRATTDNARNILENLNGSIVGCFAHTFPLGVQKSMEVSELARTLGRTKCLVSYFHHSIKSTDVLCQKERDLHHDEHNLIQNGMRVKLMLSLGIGSYRRTLYLGKVCAQRAPKLLCCLMMAVVNYINCFAVN